MKTGLIYVCPARDVLSGVRKDCTINMSLCQKLQMRIDLFHAGDMHDACLLISGSQSVVDATNSTPKTPLIYALQATKTNTPHF